MNGSNQSVSNPEYELWLQHDQLIIYWMFSSISTPILAQVTSCETSVEPWQRLNQMYSTQSMAKILDLKLQLQTFKKGGATCLQFMQHMQSLADRLRSIGTNVSDQDLVLYTLQGLGFEYEIFVTALSMRPVFPTMLELHGFLLAHEARLQSNLRSLFSMTVNYTAQQYASSGNQ